jgi:hypothetical protein
MSIVAPLVKGAVLTEIKPWHKTASKFPKASDQCRPSKNEPENGFKRDRVDKRK